MITDLVQLSPKADLQLSYYPPTFRKFFSRVKKQQKLGSRSVEIKSVPSSVNVYVNHVFVGTSPLKLNLPPNKYHIGFYANGRKPTVKLANLTKAKNKVIKAHLPWGKKSNSRNINLDTAWNKIKKTKKMVIASQISNAAHADKSLFLNIKKTANGYIPQVTIYDVRYSQMMKTISYPKPVSNLNTSHHQIANFFVKKLTPHLKESSMSYWSNHIDKDIIIDHRIASRGKKPIYKKPLFWVVAIGLITAGTATAIALSQGGSSSPSTGGVKINFDGI